MSETKDEKQARLRSLVDSAQDLGHAVAEEAINDVLMQAHKTGISPIIILSSVLDALSVELRVQHEVSKRVWPHKPTCMCHWPTFAQAGATLLMPVIGRAALEAAMNASPGADPEKVRAQCEEVEAGIAEQVEELVSERTGEPAPPKNTRCSDGYA